MNRRQMIRAAEEVLRRPDTVIQLRTISDARTTAHCSFNWDKKRASKVKLTIDPGQGGLLECALHEAIHVVLEEAGIRLGSLEEVVVAALEREIWVKGFKPKTVARWRRLINAKILRGQQGSSTGKAASRSTGRAGRGCR